ncbi:MAG: hypothetical protein HY896_07105 [Deltaproteobacteria bacterium]|nr:hypothetical protein [Deltaproteobacteria bacterium]
MRKLLGKSPLVPVAGVLVLLTAVSYLLVFSPKIREIRSLRAEVAAKEAERGNALRAWGDMAQTAGKEGHGWEDSVREWKEKVPESHEMDRLMAEIARRAVLHNLGGLRISVPTDDKTAGSGAAEGPGAAHPAEQGKANGFGELRLRLVFHSGYKDMAEFMDGIPKMKRLLSVRSVAVKEKEGEMEATVDLSAYYGMPQ